MAIYAVHSPALDGDPGGGVRPREGPAARLRALGASCSGRSGCWRKRLWLALGAWILGAAIVGFAIAFGVLRPGAGLALYGLAALFLGFEGRALAGLRPWPGAGCRSPTSWPPPMPKAPSANFSRARSPSRPRGAASPARRRPSAHEIIGLFPEAGR